jgi:23S rRNA (pseudouridine1915-N3)-methyltransferase
MRIYVIAVGRMKSSPEKSLCEEYFDRVNKMGRSLGLGPVQLREVEDRKASGKDKEAALIRKVIPPHAMTIMLDERGKLESSPDFAQRLARFRDSGTPNLAFVIGGADGLHTDLRQDANHLLSFGKMVWPHMLVRVMLSEQLYRAASILARTPYHRA